MTTDQGIELHGLSLDVTPLKVAEQKAAKAAQSRDELLQVVSHDLRNHLGSVVMQARLCRKALAARQLAPTDEVTERFERIERAANTMERLVGDLVDLEQVETGQLAVDRQPQDVLAILSDAFALLEPLARAKSIALRIRHAARSRCAGASRPSVVPRPVWFALCCSISEMPHRTALR